MCPAQSGFSELRVIFVALDVTEFKLVELIGETVIVLIFDIVLFASLFLGYVFLCGCVNNLVNLLFSVVVAIRALAFGLV